MIKTYQDIDAYHYEARLYSTEGTEEYIIIRKFSNTPSVEAWIKSKTGAVRDAKRFHIRIVRVMRVIDDITYKG